MAFPASLPPTTPTAATMHTGTLDDVDGTGTDHSDLLGRIIIDLAAVCAKVGVDSSIVSTAHEKRITDLEAADDLAAGNGISLPSAGGVTTVTNNNHVLWARRTTDNTILTNQATPQLDDVLIIPVVKNTVYMMEAYIIYKSGSTADLRLGWDVPPSAEIDWMALGAGLDAIYPGNVTGSQTDGVYTAANELTQIHLGGTGFNMGCKLWGALTTGDSDGNLTLTYAQFTSDPANTNLLAWSFVALTRVT